MFAWARLSKGLGEVRSEVERLKARRVASSDEERAANAQRLFSFYTRMMTRVLGAERCSIFVFNPEQQKVWLKAGTGVDEHDIEVPKEGSIVGRVIASGEPVRLSHLDTKTGIHKQVDERTGFVTRNVLCVPIKSVARDEVVGAVEVLNKTNDQDFTDDDVSLASEAAGHLQDAVDGVFLGQEIYGIGVRLYDAARGMMTLFFWVFVVGLLIIAGLAAYVVVTVAIN